MTLQNCAPSDYANPALPMPTPYQPAYLDDLAPCPACHNSGAPCGWCGGGGYGDEQEKPLTTGGWVLPDDLADAEPLPTIATLQPLVCPECFGEGEVLIDCVFKTCQGCDGTGMAAK